MLHHSQDYACSGAGSSHLAAMQLDMGESLGWKGKRVGNTGSHAKQALVLVNYGNAQGQEVYDLAQAIQKSIQDTYQIDLEMEVNIV